VVGLKAGSFRLEDLALWQATHGPGVSGVLALLGLVVGLLGAMARLPFDLPEAEQELMGGVTLEFGGRRLALLRWTAFVRWLVAAWLTVAVFLPAPRGLHPALQTPALALGIVLLFGLLAVASALVARLRIDHTRALLTQTALLMGFAVMFALIGA
jgi:formate hydrogenlyase subunit 4